MDEFKAGYAGIPVLIRFPKRKANPEILKQWQELDERKKKKRQEEKLRMERKIKERKRRSYKKKKK